MKTKRIASIILASFVALFAVCLLISTFVKKNYNFNFETPTTISSNKFGGEYSITTNKSQYDEVLKLYNNSFDASLISVMFSGKAFEGVKVVKQDSNKTYINTLLNGETWIKFSFNTQQEIVVGTKVTNGKVEAQKEKFSSVYIIVKNSTTPTLTNAYLVSTSSSNYSYYSLTTLAKQADLYNYLNN